MGLQRAGFCCRAVTDGHQAIACNLKQRKTDLPPLQMAITLTLVTILLLKIPSQCKLQMRVFK